MILEKINIIYKIIAKNVHILLEFLVICIMSFLIITKVLPLNDTYYLQSENNNKVVLCEITKDTVLQQPIQISDNLENLYLMFANYENRDNKGKIRFTLTQKEYYSNVIIDASEITKDNDFLKINIDLEKFSTGQATILIQGIDTEVGSSVAIYCSNDDIGFNNVTLNGAIQDKSLVQRLEYNLNGNITRIKIILFISLIFLMVFSIFILYKNNIRHKKYFLLISSLLIIIITYSINYFFMIIDAQPYAEEIINFYNSAENLDFFKNLFLADAGYLPLLQHIIAWILIRILHLGSYSIFTMNMIALFIGAFICSLINSEHLEKYVSYKTRFLLSIYLPIVLLNNFEILTFINFVYYGIILIIFAGLIDLKKLSSKKFVLLSIGISLLCLSKGFYVVMIPITLLCLFFCNRKLSLRKFILICIILITSCVELIYSLKYQNLWLNKGLDQSILETILLFIKNVLLVFSKILIGVIALPIEKMKYFEVYFIGISFLLITFLIPLYFVVIKKNYEKKYIALIFLNLTSLAISSFMVLTLPYQISFASLSRNRHEIFIIVTIFFTLIVAVSIGKEYYTSHDVSRFKYWIGFSCGVSVIMCYIILSKMITPLPEWNESPSNYYSSWNEYNKYTKKDAYAIPIIPNGWLYQKNSIIYFIGYGNSQLVGTQNIAIIEQDNNMNIINIDNYTDLVGKKIIGVYVNRIDLNNEYKIVIKGSNGSIIAEALQVSQVNKVFTGFLFDEPISNISSIEFYDSNNNQKLVRPQFYFVVEN